MRNNHGRVGLFTFLAFVSIYVIFRAGWMNMILPGKTKIEGYSASIEQAKERGVFLKEVEVTPRSLRWKQARIRIKEAWLEKGETAGTARAVDYKVYKYRVCLRLDSDRVFENDEYAGEPKPFFVSQHRLVFEPQETETGLVFCVPTPKDTPQTFRGDLINSRQMDKKNAITFRVK